MRSSCIESCVIAMMYAHECVYSTHHCNHPENSTIRASIRTFVQLFGFVQIHGKIFRGAERSRNFPDTSKNGIDGGVCVDCEFASQVPLFL